MTSVSFGNWKKLIAETKAIPATSLKAENLGKSFEKIVASLDACIEQVEGAGEAKSELKKLKAAMQEDLHNMHDLASQVARLKKLEEDFKSLSKGFRELEAKTSEACGKYFYRQQEYVRAVGKAEEQANQQLSRLRAEFLEKAESIAEGYELKVGADASNTEKLYQELMEGSMIINLTPKLRGKDLLGVFRGQEDKSRAKKEVLNYLLDETRRKITPILKDREERVAQVKGAFRDLKSLEITCGEAEKAREKAEKQIESLRVEILGVRMSKAYAYMKEETLKELKEGYLRRLEEIEGLLKAG